MKQSVSRRCFAALEPISTLAYVDEEVLDALAEIGLDPWQGYFCSRAAALGRVTADTVAALFYESSPGAARHGVRWDLASPEDVMETRHRSVVTALARRLDGSEAVAGVTRAAALLCEAVQACRPEGRPLFAAHAAFPWPGGDLASLWFGANLLREYWSDAHVAVLVSHGVGSAEALTLHSASERDPSLLHRPRSRREADAAAGLDRLVERGFFSADGAITGAGAKFREMLELDTDRLTSAPWDRLGPERCEEMLGMIVPIAERILADEGPPRFGRTSGASAQTSSSPLS